MVDAARGRLRGTEQFRFAAADAAALPFAADAFDAVTANHMLYHVPDRGAAFAEFRRVLKPGGRLYATTNGEDNMRPVYEAIADATGVDPDRATGFTLENGREQLAPFFEAVEVRRFDDGLEVTDPDALVAYALSRDDIDDSLADDLREAFRARFEDGAFRAEKENGMFVATAE
jgi:SAM-dependent methyltransferase